MIVGIFVIMLRTSPEVKWTQGITFKSRFKSGSQQGGPLAALLFALVLMAVLNLIKEEVPDLDVNAWYLDDGDLVGTKEQLQQAVDILLREGPARGLFWKTNIVIFCVDFYVALISRKIWNINF